MESIINSQLSGRSDLNTPPISEAAPLESELSNCPHCAYEFETPVDDLLEIVTCPSCLEQIRNFQNDKAIVEEGPPVSLARSYSLVFVGVILVAVVVAVPGLRMRTGKSSAVKMVKGGVLNACPDATIGQMVDNYMGSPSWKSAESEDGTKLVNISGDVIVHGKEVRAEIQFIIDSEETSFKFNALEFNEVPQVNLMTMGLFAKMCESTKE